MNNVPLVHDLELRLNLPWYAAIVIPHECGCQRKTCRRNSHYCPWDANGWRRAGWSWLYFITRASSHFSFNLLLFPCLGDTGD
jgi:hypothetical protein